MNLQQLIYFQKIAELEHYTKAAEALNITQPCLSYAVSDLEKELGAPMFYKKGRNIHLTQFGSAFLQHVNAALRELEQGKEEIAAWINPTGGRLSVSHISSMNGKTMPLIMSRFYEIPTNINISLELHEATTQELVKDLKSRKTDIGFGSYTDDPELEHYRIYQEELVLIVGNNHPLAGRKSIELKETEGYDFINYTPECGIRPVIDRLFETAETKRKVVREFRDNNIIAGMVAAGMGISVVPVMYGDEFYNVRAIRIENNIKRWVYMIWMKDGYKTNAFEKFAGFVKEMADNHLFDEQTKR